MPAVTVDLCVFAHNEAERIGAFVQALAAQDLVRDPDADVGVWVMANGCSDSTVALAHAAVAGLPPAVAGRFRIVDLPEGGKSRTWERFMRGFSRPEAEVVFFIDADIALMAGDTLSAMLAQMRARPELIVFSSRPVKDISLGDRPLGPVERIIAGAGGGLTDFRVSVCGQLYVLRGAFARRLSLPVGLPVEDGFVRAMVLTDMLTRDEDFTRIDGDAAVFHVYESLRTVRALIAHQVRIVIGSAVNAAIFARMRREARTPEAAELLLRAAAADEGWVGATLRRELPRAPHGWVPHQFLVKRLGAAWRRGRVGGLRGAATLALGWAFDVVVWCVASVKMARGVGAGFW